MRNLKYILVVLLLSVAGWSCSDDEPGMLSVTPVAEGETDGYKWVRIGSLEWMVENMSVEPTAGSSDVYVIEELTSKESAAMREKNLAKFGRLYDLEAAESIVPEGWRLPSDEDWMNLEAALGMSGQEQNGTGWRGDDAGIGTLMKQQQEGTKLNLLLGGMYQDMNGTFSAQLIDVYGFYWSSTRDTEKESAAYYCRQIGFYQSGVARMSTVIGKMMSVRCVRDAKN